MKIQRTALSAGLALTVACALAQSRVPPNSYLDRRVDTTADLVREVKTDSAVMDRYSRHFAMTREEVIAYLSSLRVGSLSEDGVYTVYGVPHASGDFHAHLRLLKKGEPVFVETDGTPVLMLVCGNPLILGPKKPAIPNSIIAMMGPPDGLVDLGAESAPVPSDNLTTVATPLDATPVDATYPTPSKSEPSIVPFLLGLAGSVQVTSGHHSSPVPEPVSALVLGGGVLALLARRKPKKG